MAALEKNIQRAKSKRDDATGKNSVSFVIANADGTVPEYDNAGLVFIIVPVPSGMFLPKAEDGDNITEWVFKNTARSYWQHRKVGITMSRRYVESTTPPEVGRRTIRPTLLVPAPEMPASGSYHPTVSSEGEIMEETPTPAPVAIPPQSSPEELAELAAIFAAREEAAKAARLVERERQDAHAAAMYDTLPATAKPDQPNVAVAMRNPAPVGATRPAVPVKTSPAGVIRLEPAKTEKRTVVGIIPKGER